MNPLAIAFVVPELNDARTRVRIDALKQQGAIVKIAGFRRLGYYSGRKLSDPVVHLGTIPQKKYFARVFKYLKAMLSIRAIASKSDVIYTFGVDLALIAWLALWTRSKKTLLVLEIEDIRDVFVRGQLLSRLFRFIDRFLAGRIDLMVVTSPLYLTEYYQKIAGVVPRNSILVENKVFEHGELSCQSFPTKVLADGEDHIMIGYFGLLRCETSLNFMLHSSAMAGGKIRFYLRGVFLGISAATIAAVEQSEYCTYAGEYVSPDELAEIYAQVDIVWACYPDSRHAVGNWLWARTNRFYEGCYFGKPIIALTGSADGAMVEEEDIGICVAPVETENATALLAQIGKAEIARWRKNVEHLPKACYIDGDQHKLLYDALWKLSIS